MFSYLSNNQFHKNEEERILKNNPLYGSIIKGDPFSIHKPRDPSDINLLSLGKFRFSPQLYSNNYIKNNQNLKEVKQQQIQQHQDEEYAETQKQEYVVESKVTNLLLNIFPVGNEYRITAEMPDDNLKDNVNDDDNYNNNRRKRFRNKFLNELQQRNIHPKKFALYINLYETNLDKL